jgi:hypothetical protein
MSLSPNPQSDADQLEFAADQAIAACDGDVREAVKALIVANHFLETELEKTARVGLGGFCARQTSAAFFFPLLRPAVICWRAR